MNIVETFERAGLRVKIIQDESPSSPRENDNVGTITAWSRDYNLSDHKTTTDDPRAFIASLAADFDPTFDADEDSNERAETIVEANLVILPVYMCGHGDVSLRVGGQSAEWEGRGQVGWIHCLRSEARDKCLADPNASEADIEAAGIKCLTVEVEEYGRYVNGEVYGYVLEGLDGRKIEDGSCWGLIGLDWAQQAAREAAESEGPALAKVLEAEGDYRRRTMAEIQNFAEGEIADDLDFKMESDARVELEEDGAWITVKVFIPKS